MPPTQEAWTALRTHWLAGLRDQVFRGWPTATVPLELSRPQVQSRRDAELSTLEFSSQDHVRLQLRVLRQTAATTGVILHIAPEHPAWASDTVEHSATLAAELRAGTVHAHVAPRGLGPTAWSGDARKQTQIRRRFLLLGQTLDAQRVWDIRRALTAVRSLDGLENAPLRLVAAGDLACNALYASLFEAAAVELELESLPASHDRGPDYLNVLKVLDVPQAVAMAVERGQVTLRQVDGPAWDFPKHVAASLHWPPGRFAIAPPGVSTK